MSVSFLQAGGTGLIGRGAGKASLQFLEENEGDMPKEQPSNHLSPSLPGGLCRIKPLPLVVSILPEMLPYASASLIGEDLIAREILANSAGSSIDAALRK